MKATTRAGLMRGTTTDSFGDTYESADFVEGFEDFPCSIIETARQDLDESTQTWRTIRTVTARLPARVRAEIQTGDRLRDLVAGVTYQFGGVTRARRGLAGRASVRMTLKTID